MRAKDADLATLWEGLSFRFEEQGRAIPRRWRWFYWSVHRILVWGSA